MDKWQVYGVYGGTFTNLKDAKACAREASKTDDYDYDFEARVWLIEDGCNYFTYQNGKLVRDGWTRAAKKRRKG